VSYKSGKTDYSSQIRNTYEQIYNILKYTYQVQEISINHGLLETSSRYFHFSKSQSTPFFLWWDFEKSHDLPFHFLGISRLIMFDSRRILDPTARLARSMAPGEPTFLECWYHQSAGGSVDLDGENEYA